MLLRGSFFLKRIPSSSQALRHQISDPYTNTNDKILARSNILLGLSLNRVLLLRNRVEDKNATAVGHGPARTGPPPRFEGSEVWGVEFGVQGSRF